MSVFSCKRAQSAPRASVFPCHVGSAETAAVGWHVTRMSGWEKESGLPQAQPGFFPYTMRGRTGGGGEQVAKDKWAAREDRLTLARGQPDLVNQVIV